MHLLPRDDKFFEMLVEQARIALDASRIAAGGLGSGAAKEIRELEIRGDKAVRAINRRLHKTFITPVDPEDIHELSELLDEVLDHLDAAAYRFDAFGMEASAGVSEITRLVHQCVEAMFEAIETLQREGVKNPDELTRRCD